MRPGEAARLAVRLARLAPTKDFATFVAAAIDLLRDRARAAAVVDFLDELRYLDGAELAARRLRLALLAGAFPVDLTADGEGDLRQSSRPSSSSQATATSSLSSPSM